MIDGNANYDEQYSRQFVSFQLIRDQNNKS